MKIIKCYQQSLFDDGRGRLGYDDDERSRKDKDGLDSKFGHRSGNYGDGNSSDLRNANHDSDLMTINYIYIYIMYSTICYNYLIKNGYNIIYTCCCDTIIFDVPLRCSLKSSLWKEIVLNFWYYTVANNYKK